MFDAYNQDKSYYNTSEINLKKKKKTVKCTIKTLFIVYNKYNMLIITSL